jgi:hypothetical protein
MYAANASCRSFCALINLRVCRQSSARISWSRSRGLNSLAGLFCIIRTPSLNASNKVKHRFKHFNIDLNWIAEITAILIYLHNALLGKTVVHFDLNMVR